ncbi:MAG: hypothetical protein FWD17_01750 [Polyangiaceae bacterium]|nr:hypothetical protein [Polyangiaceae bacterium]
MASPNKGRARAKRRSQAGNASVGAILGAASAILQVGCFTGPETAPPIDVGTPQPEPGGSPKPQPVGNPPRRTADAGHVDAGHIDAEAGSTLVDLDGEANGFPSPADASYDAKDGSGGIAEIS